MGKDHKSSLRGYQTNNSIGKLIDEADVFRADT
jgi:hypothetical protein